MERASLRPVPQRPSGPVEPAAALAHVQASLPDLDEAARHALALIDLVGRSRSQLRAETGIAEADLADALARARKALRRAAFPLPGSGWCERAERLLSDELDGELADPGPRRLAAHLANCDRCVEHERRLWQARDQLVAAFDEAHAAPPPPPVIADEPDPEPLELPDPRPEQPEEPEPPAAPKLVPAPIPELRLVTPAAEVPMPGTPEPADPVPAEPVPADPEPVQPEPVEPEPVEPAAVEPRPEEPVSLEDAVAAALPEARFSFSALAWTASLALAVLLALVSIALTVYAIAGGSL
jgi:hypothetical protein